MRNEQAVPTPVTGVVPIASSATARGAAAGAVVGTPPVPMSGARSRWWLWLLGPVLLLAILVPLTSVDTTITAADREALRDGFGVVPLPPAANFAEEIRRIAAVQRAVLKVAPVGGGIPAGVPREPLDLLRAKEGLCYDRARTIEKALKVQGFEVRHVFMLYSHGSGFLRALVARRQPSHAVTEVRTSRGWLLVGSNSPFIAVDRDSIPHTAADIPNVPMARMPRPAHYLPKYWAIRGLYSRNGLHFAPFIRNAPDVQWRELLTGLLGIE